MANYIIIGGDGKEYGPVNEAEVRQWIAEGRLNEQSRMKAESDAEYRALAQYPEFATALKPQPAPGAIIPLTADDYLERDYELDIGGCFLRGWELYKKNFGTLLGSCIIMGIVYMAAGGALNLVALPFNKTLLQTTVGVRVGYGYLYAALLSLVTGPIMGGLYLVYLKAIRGEPTGVGEVFAGFQRNYKQLCLGALMVSLITGACMLPFQCVMQVKTGPLLQQMQQMQSNPAGMQNLLPQVISAFASTLPVLLICLVPVTFFVVSLGFTLPLIMDKQMDFAPALKTSWRMVLKHWWVVFGLTVLAGLVTFLGFVGCCIGVVFTTPLGIAAQMYAYETIFGTKKN